VGVILIIVGILLWVYLIVSGGISDLFNVPVMTGAAIVTPTAVFQPPGELFTSPEAPAEDMAAILEEAAILEPAEQPEGVVPTPTAVPVAMDSPAVEVTVSLAFESNLRHGPGMEFTVLHLLAADTVLTLVGRNEAGTWLMASTADEKRGWVADSQISGSLDIMSLPVTFERQTTVSDVESFELAFGSNLRVGPGMDHEVVILLSAGTRFQISGRDSLGNWAFIQAGDYEGWIARSQLADGVDILAYPVESTIISLYEDNAEDESSSDNDAPAESTQPELPGLFSIFIESSPLTCQDAGYGSFSTEYKFNISGQSLSIVRIVDGTSTSGQYNARTGSFRTFGVHAFGQERLEGIIEFDGETITVSGLQEIVYFEDRCTGQWDIFGQGTAN
jgi:SH3-like domain-containing protein